MLNQIETIELSQPESCKSQVPFPNRKEYKAGKQEPYTTYGPLLTANPIMGKGSFIGPNCSKLPMKESDSMKMPNANIDTRNHLTSSLSNSNYYQCSGLSCRNTTVSDKNSEQEKVNRLEQEAQEYFKTHDNADTQ